MTAALRRTGLAALVLGATFVSFWPVLDSDFLQDDHAIVRMNPVVQRGDLATIFGTDYWGGVGGSEANLYRPVTILSFALERSPDGTVDPARAHCTNVLLHAVASLLLFALARRLGASRHAALASCLLFAVLPVHVSAVAGLVGRAEILALSFTVLALLFQSMAGRWDVPGANRLPGGPSMWRVGSWSAAACVFLALGSKEAAVAAPALLVVLEMLYRPPTRDGFLSWSVRFAGSLAPTVLAGTVYLVLRTRALEAFFAVQHVRLSENPLVDTDGVERLATSLAVAGRYAGLLLFPRTLSPDYSGNVVAREPSLLALLPMAGATFLLVILAVAIAPLLPGRRRPPEAWRATSLGAWMFLLPYLVIGNLFVLVGVVMAERMIYLPSAGLCLLAGLALGGMLARCSSLSPRIAVGVRAGIVLVLITAIVAGTLRTRAEARHWKNSETLFAAAVRAVPNSPRAQFTLGRIRLDQDRLDEALVHFDQATRLWPTYSAAWLEKGTILARRGRLREAEAAFASAAELNPWDGRSQLSYGIALRRNGRIDAARRQLRRTALRFPANARTAAELAALHMEAGRPAEAARWYRRAVELGRDDLRPSLRRAESAARAR